MRATKTRRHEERLVLLCSSLLVLLLPLRVSPQAKFDSGRAWQDLRQLVAIGPRPSGSPAIEQARQYIKAQLSKAGVTATEQAWDDETPLGRVHMVNVIATFPGASKNRILVTGHYDTKLFREFRFVGADDGGSSGAFLIELARALKGRTNAATIGINPALNVSRSGPVLKKGTTRGGDTANPAARKVTPSVRGRCGAARCSSQAARTARMR